MNSPASIGHPIERTERLLLLLVLAVAVLMRIPWLGELSLSNDELSALIRARQDSFVRLITNGVHIDYHPAGVEIFIHYWVRLFGEGAFMLRLPFALLSLWSVYLVYRIGKRWFNPSTGLAAAAFMAVFEFPLLYSLLARMYSPGLFFSLLAAFHWTGWIDAFRTASTVPRRDFYGLTAAMLLGPHTHYFVIVQLFAMGVSGFLVVPARYFWRYSSVCALGAFSFLAEWSVFQVQMSTGDLGGWLSAPDSRFLTSFFSELFNGYALVPIMIASLALMGIKSCWLSSTRRFYFLCGISWFLFSFLLGYGYSVLRHPALQPSTMLFSVPFLIIAFMGSWPQWLSANRLRVPVTLIFLGAGAFTTIASRGFFRQPPFGVFKEVSADVVGWCEEFGHENVAVVANTVNPDYLNYYFDRSTNKPDSVIFKVESPAQLASLRDRIDSLSERVDLIAYVWTNSLHPYEINSIIQEKYPFVVRYRSYFNAECFLYGRSYKDIPVKEVSSWKKDFSEPVSTEMEVLQDSFLVVDSLDEYVSAIDDTIFSDAEFKVFSAVLGYRCKETEQGQILVFEIKGEEGTLEWYGVRMNDYNSRPGTWQNLHLARPLPAGKGRVRLKCYIWNKDRSTFCVDKLHAKLELATDPYSRK